MILRRGFSLALAFRCSARTSRNLRRQWSTLLHYCQQEVLCSATRKLDVWNRYRLRRTEKEHVDSLFWARKGNEMEKRQDLCPWRSWACIQDRVSKSWSRPTWITWQICEHFLKKAGQRFRHSMDLAWRVIRLPQLPVDLELLVNGPSIWMMNSLDEVNLEKFVESSTRATDNFMPLKRFVHHFQVNTTTGRGSWTKKIG